MPSFSESGDSGMWKKGGHKRCAPSSSERGDSGVGKMRLAPPRHLESDDCDIISVQRNVEVIDLTTLSIEEAMVSLINKKQVSVSLHNPTSATSNKKGVGKEKGKEKVKDKVN